MVKKERKLDNFKSNFPDYVNQSCYFLRLTTTNYKSEIINIRNTICCCSTNFKHNILYEWKFKRIKTIRTYFFRMFFLPSYFYNHHCLFV